MRVCVCVCVFGVFGEAGVGSEEGGEFCEPRTAITDDVHLSFIHTHAEMYMHTDTCTRLYVSTCTRIFSACCIHDIYIYIYTHISNYIYIYI